jgi:LysR family transcriptional regulator, glycine cleavage system transcriptional activator
MFQRRYRHLRFLGCSRRSGRRTFITNTAKKVSTSVALPLLDADLFAGRLVAPLPDVKVSRTGYVALVPFDADKSAPLKAFVDWLVAEGSKSAIRPGP